jgi:hypothetical protein
MSVLGLSLIYQGRHKKFVRNLVGGGLRAYWAMNQSITKKINIRERRALARQELSANLSYGCALAELGLGAPTTGLLKKNRRHYQSDGGQKFDQYM